MSPSDSEADGTQPQPFDEEDDWMAFGTGIGHGFIKMTPKPSASDVTQTNKFYYYPGFVLGYLAKVVVLIAAVKYGLPVVA